VPRLAECGKSDLVPRIFISYRKAEVNFAAQLLDDHLCRRFGEANIFRASRAIRLGEDFSDVIWEAVRGCSVLLAVIDHDWAGVLPDGGRRIDDPQDYVRREVAAGLERDVVIPVVIAGAAPPDAIDLPEPLAKLARLQYLTLQARDSRYDLRRLLDQLADRLGEPEPARPVEPVEPGGGGVFTIGSIQVNGGDVAVRDMYKTGEAR
jgi:hypothetical protein